MYFTVYFLPQLGSEIKYNFFGKDYAKNYVQIYSSERFYLDTGKLVGKPNACQQPNQLIHASGLEKL